MSAMRHGDWTSIYLVTTDPALSWSAFFSSALQWNILFTISFHMIVYTAFVNWISWVFRGHVLDSYKNLKLGTSLLVIMYLGYIGRLLHVKQIDRAFLRANPTMPLAKRQAVVRQFIDQHYNSWIFLA